MDMPETLKASDESLALIFLLIVENQNNLLSSEQALFLIYLRTSFTSNMAAYLGSNGLSLSTIFDSHSIKDCLPNNIQFIVGKIDKNYHVAVFIAEYSDLNSQTDF